MGFEDSHYLQALFFIIFYTILTTPRRHFGGFWGAHVADQITFWELQEGFKNDMKIDLHDEVNKTALNTILTRLGTLPRHQTYCKTQGI